MRTLFTSAIENKNSRTASTGIPATQNTNNLTQQILKNTHMKTATVPSVMKSVFFKSSFILPTMMIMTFILCNVENINAQVTETFTTAGTFNWTAPAGVTSVTIEAWGAGGAGGGDATNYGNGGGGGGGGAYAKINSFPVTAGNSYSYIVGAGGVGGTGNGGNGGLSSFNTSTLVAAGGGGGPQGTDNGVAGAVLTNGGAAGSTGDVQRAGGNGFQYKITTYNYANGLGGGGGGSGGTASAGNTATSQTGASAVAGGGSGGDGGDNSAGSTPASGPGGGGGGGENSGAVPGGSRNGGAGYNGQIRITYTICTPPAAPGVTSPVNLCLNATASQLTASGSNLLWYTSAAGGTGVSTAPTPSTASAGTVSYWVSQTVGCEGPRAKIDVIVHTNPTASVSGQKNVTCYAGTDGELTVQATGGSGSGYTFSKDNGSSYVGSGNLYTFTGLDAVTPYKIRVKDANGCQSPSIP